MDPDPDPACVPCDDCDPECVATVACCPGTYYHSYDGPSVDTHTAPVHEACLHIQHDASSDETQSSIMHMLNEYLSRKQCDGASSELAGEAVHVQQVSGAGSEPTVNSNDSDGDEEENRHSDNNDNDTY